MTANMLGNALGYIDMPRHRHKPGGVGIGPNVVAAATAVQMTGMLGQMLQKFTPIHVFVPTDLARRATRTGFRVFVLARGDWAASARQASSSFLAS